MGSAMALLAAAATVHAGPPVLYVDDDAPAGGNGESWEQAFRDLRDAISASVNATNAEYEIRVAQGVYRPDRGTGNQGESFFFTSAAPMLLGGFAGLGSADPDERDPKRFATVLSGDLNGDDLPHFGNREDNARHVVRVAIDVSRPIVLDGFTILGGYARRLPFVFDGDSGGAVYADYGYYAPLVVRRCRITGNWAESGGGGIQTMYVETDLQDCVFDQNGSACGGGAIAAGPGPGLHVARCTFSQNFARSGGAVNSSAVTVTIANSLFEHNDAPWGSAVQVVAGDAHFVSCTMYRNGSAGQSTIGIESASSEILGCIVHDGPDVPGPRTLIAAARSSVRVDRTNIAGGELAIDTCDSTIAWGSANIDADPEWTLPAGPDGLPQTWEDNDFSLRAGSPCIDTGYTALRSGSAHDLYGRNRTSSPGCVCASRADIGAAEFQFACDAPLIDVLYVDAHAPAGGNGRSWATAYQSLDEALHTPGAREVWVAAGTYTPASSPSAEGRDRAFLMNCELRLYGGFAGTETQRGQRNPDLHATVLSADVLGNDSAEYASLQDNTFSVVATSGGQLTLDGFTISGAYSDLTPSGAVRASSASLTMRDCSLRGNLVSADFQNAAAALWTESCDVSLQNVAFERNAVYTRHGVGAAAFLVSGSARLIGCRFVENTCDGFYSLAGAGLYVEADDAVLESCSFARNIASSHSQIDFTSAFGSGLLVQGDGTRLANCTFIANQSIATGPYSATGSAGAHISGAGTQLVNCLFAGNVCDSSYQSNAAAASLRGYAPSVVNCTFVNNSARADDVLTGGVTFSDPDAAVINCILRDNQAGIRRDALAQIDYVSGALVTPVNSCIQGWTKGLPGLNVILANPRFVNPLGLDGVGGTGDEDYSLAADSPCLDSGDASRLPIDPLDLDRDGDTSEPLPIDLRGGTRVSGAGLDIGAFERFGGVCRVDLITDGRVDTLDFFQYLSWFFEQHAGADFDGDGAVSSADLFSYIQEWTRGC